MYLGDYVEDSVLYFTWGTNDTNGASITRSTNGTVQVYKDDGTTESVAGVTDTEDFDGLTGLHMCKIDLSADAFYLPGHDYSVVLNGAVIDTRTVYSPLAMFSIENRTTSAVKTVVDAIQAKTDNLPAAPADDTSIDSQLGVIDAVADAVKVVTDKIDEMLEVDGPIHRLTANALEQAPAGGGGSGMPTME
ncbi:MAG TPA: hypothetical protein VMY87_06245 [Armatimonadota bacterium]|nr:hypothetical protein [Armatimonadota bacterium]